MEDFSKEGRKLRPRRAAGAGTSETEKVEFNPRSNNGEGLSSGVRRREDGESRPYGERRSFGGPRREGGESRPYGEHRSFGGSRREGGESRPYGERRSFGGPRREGGESRPYGERRSFGGPRREDGESRPYGERRSFSGPKREFGPKRGFGASKPRTGGPGRSFGSKRPFGPKRGFAFDERSEEGINRMISTRPLVENSGEQQEISVPIFKEEVRLNKFIANSGVCSRREADTLIQAGVVTVNGEVVTELGVKINVSNDDIRFNGQRLKGEEKVYIVLNKPKGFVTTASDPHADKTIMDLIKNCSSRVYPVGRLDKNTTGVLMLTNDGEMAERLSHPAYEKKKIYQVSLDKELQQEDYDAILSGIVLSDGPINADSLEYIDETDHRKLGIEIHSGKNRIVRRIFEHLGYNVKALDRVYFAGLTKKGLKKGEWRYLSESEVGILRMGAYM